MYFKTHNDNCYRFSPEVIAEASTAFYNNLESLLYEQLTADKIEAHNEIQNQSVGGMATQSRPSVIVENVHSTR